MFLPYRITNALLCLLFRAVVGPFFGSFGRRSSVLAPKGIEGIKNVYIGKNVYISNGALLAAMPLTKASDCKLIISDNCSIGRNNHFFATREIIIGEGVLTANNVYISDNAHAYSDVKIPVKFQPIVQLRSVEIGSGSWLGQNVCVLGARVGKGCVIGANSVVNSDIPDYSVAVGAPARVIKRFDPIIEQWVSSR